jgi:CubicO group peptidase (beta-lactamase class C family)
MIDKAFREIVDKDYSGVISIYRNEKALFKEAFGYADIPNKRPNQLHTKFAIASGSKIFTAVAILKLIEEKELSLDACIGDLLPFDLKEIDPKITIHQLLCHLSGIPDYFDETTMDDYDAVWENYPNYKVRTSMDLVPLFIDKPMMYLAGQKFQYNNTGYVVLGLIIETVSGESFDAYVKKTIFTPSDMTDTGYYAFDRLPSNCATGYILDEEGHYYTNIYSVDVKGSGAGGAYITSDDMRKFWDALLSYKLLSKEMVDEMLSPKARDAENIYGYGVWISEQKNAKYIYYIQGSDPGVSFFSFIDPQEGLSATLMSNTHDNVWRYYRDILLF